MLVMLFAVTGELAIDGYVLLKSLAQLPELSLQEDVSHIVPAEWHDVTLNVDAGEQAM